ncbi:MAG: acyl-CoA thioesterase [Bacteroidaceae bacterium]|nr:acyl-CoA thioesterase [Prevotellaceae bacterium]MDY3063895.1 acyl-CoA thioesterase [Bacteroidaceae bacterium]
MKDYIFKLRMAVRDYECDIEGIVNNANYLHYMEHTRHQFLLTKGVSFIELHRRGIDTVVARINVQYKTPLTSDTEFDSCLNVRKEGVKYVFYQDIYRVEDEKLCVRATVEAVAVVNGRLAESPELDMMLK